MDDCSPVQGGRGEAVVTKGLTIEQHYRQFWFYIVRLEQIFSGKRRRSCTVAPAVNR